MAEITRKQWLEKCAAGEIRTRGDPDLSEQERRQKYEEDVNALRMQRTEEEQLHDMARILASELAPLYKQMETQLQRRDYCTKETQKVFKDTPTAPPSWAIHQAAARQFETDMIETGARIEGLIFRYLDPERRPALNSAYNPEEAGK